MKFILFYIVCVKFILSYNLHPPCNICRWFIPNTDFPEMVNYGFCKMFKENYISNGKKTTIYNFAKHCRNNQSMCGKEGFLFDKITNDYDTEKEQQEISNLLDEYEEISNRLSGEVNEQNEIEEIEMEFYNLFQRVKSVIERKIEK